MWRRFKNSFGTIWIFLAFPVLLLAESGRDPICQGPSLKPSILCEESGEFLCLNTTRGSSADPFFILRGKLSLDGDKRTHLTIRRQHEMTRAMLQVPLATPQTENCWEAGLTEANNFCLESGGRFAVHVPLPELGPYTIVASASRTGGDSMERRLRTSHVIAPTVTPDVLSFDPGLNDAAALNGASHARVSVDLLKDCGISREACDFIGAATGGVVVTMENRAEGQQKYIRCGTDTQIGEAGRFTIGIPLLEGKNQFHISICNAATGFDPKGCPTLKSVLFTRNGAPRGIEILSPLNAKGPLYFSPSKHPNIDLKFRIPGFAPEECGDHVTVGFNMNPANSLCPDAGGIYHLPLMPKEGYNTVQISVRGEGVSETRTVHFGWGEPLEKTGEVWRLGRAMTLSISETFLNDSVGWIENYFHSKDFADLLAALGNPTRQAGSAGAEVVVGVPESEENLPDYCRAEGAGGMAGLRMEMTRPPSVGSVEIEPFHLSRNRLEGKLILRDVAVGMKLVKEGADPLPLKIAFKEATLEPILEIDASGRLKFSAPQTDCRYKRKGACLKMPALFVPKKYVGAAAKSGAFAVCDTSVAISDKMDRICHALNVVDRQTGVFQIKVLDAVNKMFACAGGKIGDLPLAIDHPVFHLNGAVSLDRVRLEEKQIAISLATVFGDRDPRLLRPKAQHNAMALAESGVSAEVSLALLTQLFAGLTDSGGNPFSLTINEDFLNETVLKERGVTLEELCGVDREGDPDPLCSIRPRVSEILGTQIAESGYVGAKDPLDLVLRPPQDFPLRVTAMEEAGKIGVEFAGLELEIRHQENEIITALLSGQLNWEIGETVLLPEDPEHFTIRARLVKKRSQVWILAKEGSNKTVLSDTSLLNLLENKVKFGLDILSLPEKELKIKIPRFVLFPADSFFSRIGLKELTWAHNGFDLRWLPENQSLLLRAILLAK